MPGFEQKVREQLDGMFPCSALSNIPIYRPDVPEEKLTGYEIDHLLHVSSELSDRLIIIECKEGRIFGETDREQPTAHGPWNVRYRDPPHPKDVKRVQLRNHGRALRAYLQDRSKPLFIEAWLVSQLNPTFSLEDKRGRYIHFRLLGEKAFLQELARVAEQETVLRVEQSALLGELRKGVPLPDMRHPELHNTLAYVERCRRSIDMELFRAFDPKPHLWAINGTAGMGKSVLLAYALFVFASDRQVVVDTTSQDDIRFLKDYSQKTKQIGLPEYGKRTIYVVARKEKQLSVIEHFWNRFVAEYSLLDEGLSLRFQKPVFRRWSRSLLNNEDCNVLLIDESHDLDADDQAAVQEWHGFDKEPRYLAIACDRHQKLQLVGTDATLIEGLNFSRHTIKLRRNYRNPFSVYAAGLALMFRWCAPEGPKMIPTKLQLLEEFGFEVTEYSEAPRGRIALQNWNDSHPGNYWCFTVSTFLSCEDAYAQLSNARLEQDQVLWVRFAEEEETFDYEKLLAFTYHNCHTAESFEFVDKYIKGQEFPVVVIEGFPPEANLSEFSESVTAQERAMWAARRELYLCCSRATTFLYFVLPKDSSDDAGIAQEIREIVRQVSAPENPMAITRRVWQIEFKRTSVGRKVDAFLQYGESEEGSETPPTTPTEIRIRRPITVRRLADILKIKVENIVSDLFEVGCTFRLSTDIVADDLAKEAALRQGVVLNVEEGTSAPAPSGQVQMTAIEESASAREDPKESTPSNKASLALMEYLSSPSFPASRSAVEKYIAILDWLIRTVPGAREHLLGYRRANAARRFFARSKQEIFEHASSPNPHPIHKSGVWALTTMSNKYKREVLEDILRGCQISLAARQKAVTAIS
jgi:negative regulator of replication initiation